MSGTPTKRIADGAVTPAKFSTDLFEMGAGYYDGSTQPLCSKLDGSVAATGATGDTNIATFVGALGFSAQYHVKGAGQTLLTPLLDTSGNGLDISQDQTDDEGVEYVPGTINSNSPFAFTVGTHNAIFEVNLKIADVSGTDDLCVGFRKLEAYQTGVDSYDEAAFINVILGDVKVETILNNAATVTTDSGENWADGETHKLTVYLRGRQVLFFMDDEELPGIPDFVFDNTEVVVPFLFFLQATTSPGKVWVKHMKVGRLRAFNTLGQDS